MRISAATSGIRKAESEADFEHLNSFAVIGLGLALAKKKAAPTRPENQCGDDADDHQCAEPANVRLCGFASRLIWQLVSSVNREVSCPGLLIRSRCGRRLKLSHLRRLKSDPPEILSLKGDSYRLRGKDLDARPAPHVEIT